MTKSKKQFLVPMKLSQALLLLGACDARLKFRDMTIKQAFEKADARSLRWIWHRVSSTCTLDRDCILCRHINAGTPDKELKQLLAVTTFAQGLRKQLRSHGVDLVDPLFRKKVK